MITDTAVEGTTTVGSAYLTVVPPGSTPTSIVATAGAGADAVIEIGYQTGTDPATFRPALAPRVLRAGMSSRIRFPAFRMNPGGQFRMVARSSAPVQWVANLINVPAVTGNKTSFRVFDAPPRVRTAIYGPNSGEKQWRGVSVFYCNRSAASSVVTLSLRVQNAGGALEYRDFGGPVLVPPFGGIRLSPFPDLDLQTALFGQSETLGTFYAYGVMK